jgi:hypothetical protein
MVKRHLIGHSPPSLEVLIDVLCQGQCELAADAERLRSFTGFPHFKITF